MALFQSKDGLTWDKIAIARFITIFLEQQRFQYKASEVVYRNCTYETKLKFQEVQSWHVLESF